MGTLTFPFTLTAGQPENVNQLNSNLAAIQTVLNGQVDATNLAALGVTTAKLADLAVTIAKIETVLAQQLGLNNGANVGRGKFIQATGGTTVSASYAALSNGPDRVASVVLPTDGLIMVSYSATWSLAAGAVASAAIFLGANQAQGWSEDSATLVAQEAVMTTTKVNALTSGQAGLVSTNGAANSVPGPSTNGTIVGLVKVAGGNPFSYGGFTLIEAAAGTYNVDVQFKTSASTLTVSNRKLKVLTAGF